MSEPSLFEKKMSGGKFRTRKKLFTGLGIFFGGGHAS